MQPNQTSCGYNVVDCLKQWRDQPASWDTTYIPTHGGSSNAGNDQQQALSWFHLFHVPFLKNGMMSWCACRTHGMNWDPKLTDFEKELYWNIDVWVHSSIYSIASGVCRGENILDWKIHSSNREKAWCLNFNLWQRINDMYIHLPHSSWVKTLTSYPMLLSSWAVFLEICHYHLGQPLRSENLPVLTGPHPLEDWHTSSGGFLHEQSIPLP